MARIAEHPLGSLDAAFADGDISTRLVAAANRSLDASAPLKVAGRRCWFDPTLGDVAAQRPFLWPGDEPARDRLFGTQLGGGALHRRAAVQQALDYRLRRQFGGLRCGQHRWRERQCQQRGGESARGGGHWALRRACARDPAVFHEAASTTKALPANRR